jgi:hypothetical protein
MDVVVPSPPSSRGKIFSMGAARAPQEPHPLSGNSATSTPTSTPTPSQATSLKDLGKSKLSSEIALIQTMITSSRPSKEELSAWEKIKQALIPNSTTSSSASSELLEVKNELKSLTSAVQKLVVPSLSTTSSSLASSNTRSYSDVLKRELVLPSRRSRELVVSLGSETEDEKKRTGEALVKALKNPSSPSSLEIIAARRLPSTDIAITFSSTSACQQWEASNSLDQAKIKTRDYNVIIPRFPRGLSPSALDLIDSLKVSNPRLDVHFTKATFLKKGLATQYPRIPLVLSLKEPQQANLVCEKGLVYKGEIYDCELFCGDARPKRCLKCQKYTSHIAKHCRSIERCGYCGGTHSSSSCLSKEDKAKAYCVPCSKKGHNAFSTSCPSWRLQLERSRAAYLSRPNRFQIPPSTPLIALTPSCTDEFTVVQPRKRRLQSGQTKLSFSGTSLATTPTPFPFPSSSVPLLTPTQNTTASPNLQGIIPCSQDTSTS